MIQVKFRKRTFKFPMLQFETAENLRGAHWLDRPWEDLFYRDGGEVSVRTYNCLYHYYKWGTPPLVTIRDLTALSFKDLTKIKNMGAVSASEVTAALYAIGLYPAPCDLDNVVSVECVGLEA